MTLRFYGKPDQYAKIIQRISRHRYWHDPSSNSVRCNLERDVVVHWCWETGTVLFDGPREAASHMKAKFVHLAGP
jgi:hypothetical protein